MPYDRRTVEELLSTIWDCHRAWGFNNQSMPDPDMPTTKTDPSKSATVPVVLADIGLAWKRTPLSLKERRSVFLRHALDLPHKEVAEWEGCSRPVISTRLYVSIGKIVATLNGTDFEEGDDTIEE